MRLGLLAGAGVTALSMLLSGADVARAQWSTDPVYFFCYAGNPADGVVYVSDVHKVGPLEERRTYPERYEAWLRASGRLGEGKGRCLMRATEREIERDRRDLPVSGCFDCQGPYAYRDVTWPFGDRPVDSIRTSQIEPGRPAMSSIEEVELDRREDPRTRPGTTVYGRIDFTDALFRSGSGDSQAQALAATREKGGKWYPVTVDDRCAGWASVSFAASASNRRYFIGRAVSEAGASANALDSAKAYVAGREGWETGLLLTYFNDTVEGDDRSLGDKAMDAVKGWVRGQVVDPDAQSRPLDYTCFGVRG